MIDSRSKSSKSAGAKSGRISGRVPGRITGQGMTEYIIIVALIAIAAITAVSMFGSTVQGQFAGLAGSLAGTGPEDGKKVASDSAEAAVDGSGAKTLSTY